MIPAQVHLKLIATPSPGLWLRAVVALVASICITGCLAGTAASILDIRDYAGTVAILAMIAAVIVATFSLIQMSRRRLEFLVLHTAFGAKLYARFKRANGTIYDQRYWETLKSVKYDRTTPALHVIRYSDPVLFRCDSNGEEQVLIVPGGSNFGDFDITAQTMETLAAEINRQQDGSWKRDPHVLVDDDVELDIDPGWDEKAPPTPPHP